MNSVRSVPLAIRRGASEETKQQWNGDRSESAERLKWWKKTQFADHAPAYSSWLKAAGFADATGADGFVEIDGPIPDIKNANDRRWVEHLGQVMSSPRFRALAEDPNRRREIAAERGLGAIVWPFVDDAEIRALASFEALKARGINLDPVRATAAFRNYIDDLLCRWAMPSAGLAINIARVEGLLIGETPEDRAVDFADQLLVLGSRDVHVGHFPMLDRMLAEVSLNAIEANKVLLRHLESDLPDLRHAFDLGTRALSGIRFGFGDPHMKGKTVAILAFEDRRVVYKPRSLSTDSAFYAVLDWLRPRVPLAPSSMRIIDRGDHGWAEFIAYAECQTPDEVKDCYRRMGVLVAALHACCGSDIHHENVICRGADPFIVDLEALLTSLPKDVTAAGTFESAMTQARHTSVLATGYLPSPLVMEGGMFDLSAGGAVSEQVSPIQGMKLGGTRRDDVHAEPSQLSFQPLENVPRLAGVVHPVMDYADEFCESFADAYRALAAGWATDDFGNGPLSLFRSMKTRWVARGTLRYAEMLRKARLPTHMRDACDFETAFSPLWLEASNLPYLERLIPSELADMWHGDIPFFVARADSRDLETPTGQVIAGFFAKTGYELLLERLSHLNERDLRHQIDVIRTSFRSSILKGGPDQPDDHVEPASWDSTGNLGRYLAAAEEIGDQIVRSAITIDGLPFWMTHNSGGTDFYFGGYAQSELYDGVAGIGVFLGELHKATGSPRFRKAAAACLSAVRGAFGEGPAKRIGAYSGLAGLIYADARISDCLGEDRGEHLNVQLGRLIARAPTDEGLDIIEGAAGVILVALEMAQTNALSDAAMATARAYGDRLVETAVRCDGTARWEPGSVKRALTGLAHGTTGIAYALAELAAASGDELYAQLADEALAFDETTFDTGAGIWADLREDTPTSSAWCHGPPGMTLALNRIRRHKRQSSPALNARIEAGLRWTKAHGAGGSHCLCHGALGNAEVFLACGEQHHPWAHGLAEQALVERELEGRWRGGIASFEAHPGLMVGSAGVGLQFLRLRDPTIPSVLALGPTQ